MVARVMELVNATRKAIDSGCGPADPAVREAAEAVAILLSLVAPYTAEEMWERLGHQPTVARAGWPAVDEALLVEDSVTAVVQVQGKVRARLHRPDSSPELDAELDHRWLHEGQGTTSRLSIRNGEDVEHVTRVMAPTPYVALHPPNGLAAGLVGRTRPRSRSARAGGAGGCWARNRSA